MINEEGGKRSKEPVGYDDYDAYDDLPTNSRLVSVRAGTILCQYWAGLVLLYLIPKLSFTCRQFSCFRTVFRKVTLVVVRF